MVTSSKRYESIMVVFEPTCDRRPIVEVRNVVFEESLVLGPTSAGPVICVVLYKQRLWHELSDELNSSRNVLIRLTLPVEHLHERHIQSPFSIRNHPVPRSSSLAPTGMPTFSAHPDCSVIKPHVSDYRRILRAMQRYLRDVRKRPRIPHSVDIPTLAHPPTHSTLLDLLVRLNPPGLIQIPNSLDPNLLAQQF
jgi:hypothetical protein